jgi:hypothetical protein
MKTNQIFLVNIILVGWIICVPLFQQATAVTNKDNLLEPNTLFNQHQQATDEFVNLYASIALDNLARTCY